MKRSKAYFVAHYIIFIPVTGRVKGYTRFVRKYVTGRMKRFRPHKVHIFLIRIDSRVDHLILIKYFPFLFRNYQKIVEFFEIQIGFYF